MFDAIEYEQMREDYLSRQGSIFCIPRKVLSYEADSLGVSLKIKAKEYVKGKLEPFFLQDDLALLPTGVEEIQTLRLEFWGPDTLRFRGIPAEAVTPHDTPMVNGVPRPEKITLEEDEGILKILSGNLIVTVRRDPYALTVSDREGRVLLQQYTEDLHAISHIVKGQNTAFQDSFSGFESYPLSLARSEEGTPFWTDAVRIAYDEHFFGFGEQFGPLDKLGQEVLVWQSDALSSSTAKAYKNIPFFLSSKGYGLFVNSSAKSRFQMGSYHYKALQMVCHDREIDYFVIRGPRFKEILSRYTDITGKTPMLPAWSFGLWMSKNTYRTQEELLEVAALIREKEIPCDVVHLDVGWFEQDWMCDFEFSRERFPRVREMTERLKEMGFRLSLWQLPYFKKENKLYPIAEEKGYFARTDDGRVSSPEADGVLDISNPAAVAWYQDLLGQVFDQGVSVIKVDFGESAEEDANYAGCEKHLMHNLYPLLYNKAVYEKTAAHTGEGIIWGRSAFAGSQRYPLHWGGDANTDFDGMYHSLRGGLSFGMTAFPFWSHDVGGYYCDVDPEVYIRWAQMGFFSSHMRMHGTTSREPWMFGPEIEEIFLKYARLRYRLLPYILSEARHCCDQSLPLLRALVLEFQDDPTCYGIDDQYLFGSQILVAPVFSKETARNIYLPAGCRWFDFHTRRAYEGGQWIRYDAPLDILPLFVREGACLAYAPAGRHVGESDFSRLELQFYGREDIRYDLKLQENTGTIRCTVSRDEALITLPEGSILWSLEMIDQERSARLRDVERPKDGFVRMTL